MRFSFRDGYKVLSKNELELIHCSSLEILRKIGVHVPHERFLSMLKNSGMKVDCHSSIVKFPSALVEKHIEQARNEMKQTSIGKNHQEKGNKVIGYVGGFTTRIRDMETEELHMPTKNDLRDAIILGNNLEAVATNAPLFLPIADVPPHTEDIWCCAMNLLYNTKESSCLVLNKSSLRPMLEMCDIAREGLGTSKKSPALGYQCFISSPLRFPFDALDIALAANDLGMPIHVGSPMVVCGGTGPVTLAGTLALSNAETLAGLVMTHALSKKYDRYSGNPITMDMRTGSGSYANPKSVLLNAANADINRFYGFPIRGGHLGDTDASYSGIQAAAERVFTTLINAVVSEDAVEIGIRIGVLGPTGSLGYLPQMVIDAEICGVLNSFLQGIKVSPEEMLLESIEKVGIGGSFLTEEHTLKHMREQMWFSELFDGKLEEKFEEEKVLRKAKETVRKILKKEVSHPLSKKEEEEIFKIARSCGKAE